jgi:hypothetical protein
MDIFRSTRDVLEKTFGVRIVWRHVVPLAFAEEELRRFIDHFEVDCFFERMPANIIGYCEQVGIRRSHHLIRTTNRAQSANAEAREGRRQMVHRGIGSRRTSLQAISSARCTKPQKLGFRRPFLKIDTHGHDLSVVHGAGVRLNFRSSEYTSTRRRSGKSCDFTVIEVSSSARWFRIMTATSRT